MPFDEMTSSPDLLQLPAPGGVDTMAPQPPQASLAGGLAANFTENNQIASLFVNDAWHTDNSPAPEPEGGFSGRAPYSGIEELKKNPKYLEMANIDNDLYMQFANSKNPTHTFALMQDLDRREEHMRAIEALPTGLGLVSGLVAGALDPSIFLPGGVIVGNAKKGYSLLRSGANVALAGAGAAAVQEAGLHLSQPGRTGEESLVNIGGAAVLAGLFGAGIAGAVNRSLNGEAEQLLKHFDVTRTAALPIGPVEKAPKEDITVALQKAPTGFSVENRGDVLLLRPNGIETDNELNTVGLHFHLADDGIHVDGSYLPEASRGKGIGKAMYQHILNVSEAYGVPVRSDDQVSPEAQRFYEGLKSKGYNVEKNPTAEFDDDGKTLYADGPVYTVTKSDAGMTQGGAAGADVPNAFSRADLELSGGKAVKSAAWLTGWLNPVGRASHRFAPLATELIEKMSASSLYRAVNDFGVSLAPGGSASAKQKVLYGYYENALRSHGDLYKRLAETGTTMDQDTFDRVVGQTVRNPEASDNPVVQEAAQMWRQRVIEPLAEAYKAAGGEIPEFDEKTGVQYFTRVYSDLVNTHSDVFYQRMVPYAQQVLKDAYAKQLAKHTNRLDWIDRDLTLLRMGHEERVNTLNMIEDQYQKFTQQNASMSSLTEDIADASTRLREAQQAGDYAARDRIRGELEQLKSRDVEARQKFLNEKREFGRAKRVLESVAKQGQDKIDELTDRLTDYYESQRAALDTLVQRAGTFYNKMNSLDETRFADQAKSLADRVRGLEEQSNKALDRAAKQRQAIDEQIAQAQEAAKEAVAGAGTNIEAIKTNQEQAVKLEASLKPLKEKLEKTMAAEQARAERYGRALERFQAATDGSDRDFARQQLREGMDMLVAEQADKALARGQKAARLQEKLAKLMPDKEGKTPIDRQVEALQKKRAEFERKFADNWEVKKGMIEDPDFANLAKAMVDDMHLKVSDRYYGSDDPLRTFITPTDVGPLRNRAWMPDSLLAAPIPGTNGKSFLEDNVREVMHIYARRMSGITALRDALGTTDLKNDILPKLTEQYTAMREAIDKAQTVEEVRQIMGRNTDFARDRARALFKGTDLQKAKEAARKALINDERGAKDDINAVYEINLGTYKVREQASNFGRLARAANSFNVATKAGGFVLSNLTELFLPAFREGMTPWMQDGLLPLIKNLEAVKASMEDLKAMNLLSEHFSASRLASISELADRYSDRTAPEKFMQNVARGVMKWSGLPLLTDFEQVVAGNMVQNRILRLLKKPVEQWSAKDLRYGALIGLDPKGQSGVTARLQALVQKHSTEMDGFHIANTDKWTVGLEGAERTAAERAMLAYRTAVRTDVDSLVPTPYAADKALFAHTPVGSMLLQFRAYNMSANQKVMLRGLQEANANMIGGLIAMTSIGILQSYLKAAIGGQDRFEKWKQSASNPGFLVGEGFDQAGLAPVFMDLSQSVDAVARTAGKSFNPVKTPLLWPFPGASQAGDQSRWARGDALSSLAGPSVGLINQVPRAAGAVARKIAGEEVPAENRRALNGIIPGATLPYFRVPLNILQGN